MQPFQATGIWWTPDNPSSPVAGTLHFSDEEGLYLALIGMLGDARMLTRERRPLILGSAYDLPGGQQITLRHCQQRGVTVGVPGFSREEYLVSRAFIGGHLERETDFGFRRAQLKLRGLADWAQGLTGIHVRFGSDGNELCRLVYTRPESLIAQVPAGQVKLGVCSTFSQTLRKCIVEEDVAFDIECEEPLSDDEFNARYVYPLQNFVTLALGRPAAVREFSVRRGDDPGGPDNLFSLRVVRPLVFTEEQFDEETNSSLPLFLLPNVGDRFADIIRRWLQVTEKFADTCNLFFGIQYMPKSYLDTRFLAVVQALELYQANREGWGGRQKQEGQRYDRVLGSLAEEDREWLRLRLGRQPHVPFSDTLAALVSEHGAVVDPLCDGDRNGFLAAVRAAWEYILHRRLVSDKAPQSDEDLYWLMERLRIVMKACFLSELGFSEAERVQLFNGNALYQHLRNLGWRIT
jgi:ApeA N-terminal domain 1